MRELEALSEDELDKVSGGMGRRPGNGEFETIQKPDPRDLGSGWEGTSSET